MMVVTMVFCFLEEIRPATPTRYLVTQVLSISDGLELGGFSDNTHVLDHIACIQLPQ
jgi:hypothetical protein